MFIIYVSAQGWEPETLINKLSKGIEFLSQTQIFFSLHGCKLMV